MEDEKPSDNPSDKPILVRFRLRASDSVQVAPKQEVDLLKYGAAWKVVSLVALVALYVGDMIRKCCTIMVSHLVVLAYHIISDHTCQVTCFILAPSGDYLTIKPKTSVTLS